MSQATSQASSHEASITDSREAVISSDTMSARQRHNNIGEGSVKAIARVIAIDGPCGAGKSSVAKELSRRLGFNYLDTGALYRAVALKLIRLGLTSQSDDHSIQSTLTGTRLRLSGDLVYLDDEDVSDMIRSPEIGLGASVFSARKPVRDFLLVVQKEAAATSDLVAEGRDIGSKVFPEAWEKFYVTAGIEVRAKRRYDQLLSQGKSVSMQDAIKDVTERDQRDSSRALSPLRKAEDAIEIDTTNMTFDEVIDTIIMQINKGRG